jgi:hypothetical protein
MGRIRVRAEIEGTYEDVDRDQVAPSDVEAIWRRKLPEALQHEPVEVTVTVKADDQ